MTTRLFHAVALIWLMLCGFGFAADKLSIRGDLSIKSKIENTYSRIASGSASDTAAGEKLVAWLVEQGYLDAGCTYDSGHVAISTGSLITLHAIVLAGNEKSPIEVDRPFTRDNLRAWMERALEPFQDSGYFYCRASVRLLERSGDEVVAVVSVTRGPIVKAKAMSFVGLDRTKPQLLTRWLRFESGSNVTDGLLQELSGRAGTIPFAEFRGPIVVKPLAGYDESVLQLNFVEKKQFLIDGGAGYDPDQANGLVWSLNLKLQNLFGSGRDISVLSARRQIGNNLLDIAYSQPLFLVGVGDLHGRISTRNFQNQFYEFSAIAGLTSAIRPNQSFGLDLGWKRVDPETGLAYRGYEATVSYSLGRPDQRVAGDKGFRFASSIGYLYRSYNPDSLGGGNTFNDTRAEFEASYGQPIWRGWSAWGRVNYRGIESKEDPLPNAELYFIGGPGTLRGFRTDQFVVQRAALGTIEPRLSFSSGYLFAFWDAAYLNLGKGIGAGEKEMFRVGYGFGATISDRNRSVSISFGWNKELSLDQPQLAIKVTSVL